MNMFRKMISKRTTHGGFSGTDVVLEGNPVKDKFRKKGRMSLILTGIAMLLIAGWNMAEAAVSRPEPVRILVGRFSDATPKPAPDTEQQEKDRQLKSDQRGKADVEFIGKKISFDLENADLRYVIELIIEITNSNDILADDVSGTISTRFVSIPSDLVMTMIFEQAGLEYVEQPEGRIIRRGSGYAGSLDGSIRIKDEKTMNREEVLKRYQAALSINMYQTNWTGRAILETILADLTNMSSYDVLRVAHYDHLLSRSASTEQRNQYPLNACDQVVGGSYRIEGDNVTFNLELVSAVSGTMLFNKIWSGKIKDLPGMLSRTVVAMAKATNAAINDAESKRVLARKTESVEAWRLNAKQSWITDYSRDKNRKVRQAEADKERTALLEAVRLDLDYAEAWNKLGWVYIENRRLSEIGKKAERAQRVKENNEKAAEAFGKALKIKPDLIEALIGMGTVLEGKDDETALTYYRKGTGLNPLHHEGSLYLFDLLVKLKKSDEASEVGLVLVHDKSSRYILNVLSDVEKLRSRNAVLAMVELLKHPKPYVRERAVEGLLSMTGLKADSANKADDSIWLKNFQGAVPVLIELLSDPLPKMRRNAAAVLGAVGDKAAMEPLLRTGKDADASVRREAVKALGNLPEVSAQPDFPKFLKDPDMKVRLEAAAAIGRIGAKGAATVWLPVLHEALRDADPVIRSSAAESLGKINDKAAVPILIYALKDEDKSVRWRSAEALAKLGHKAAVPVLIDMFKNGDTFEKGYAANELGKLNDKAAVPIFIDALKDEDETVRWRSAEALGHIVDKAAVPALISALTDSSYTVRYLSAEALGKTGDRTALPALREALQDSNMLVRVMAAGALGEMKDKSSVGVLGLMVKDPDKLVRRTVASTLWKIDDRAAVPVLIDMLKDEDKEVRISAVFTLRDLKSKSAIPALIALLKDDDRDVRAWAAIALGNMDDNSGLRIMTEALSYADEAMFSWLASVLGDLNVPLEVEENKVMEKLKHESLENPKNTNRLWAAYALARKNDESGLLILREALNDKAVDVRASAARFLGMLAEKNIGFDDDATCYPVSPEGAACRFGKKCPVRGC